MFSVVIVVQVVVIAITIVAIFINLIVIVAVQVVMGVVVSVSSVVTIVQVVEVAVVVSGGLFWVMGSTRHGEWTESDGVKEAHGIDVRDGCAFLNRHGHGSVIWQQKGEVQVER